MDREKIRRRLKEVPSHINLVVSYLQLVEIRQDLDPPGTEWVVGARETLFEGHHVYGVSEKEKPSKNLEPYLRLEDLDG